MRVLLFAAVLIVRKMLTDHVANSGLEKKEGRE